jgi:uridylate kinase
MTDPRYKRILLKISGEAFSGKAGYGIDAPTINHIAIQIKHVVEMALKRNRPAWIGSQLITLVCWLL